MSTTRPEREEDCSLPGPSPRPADLQRVTAVSGPAEVQARVDLQLAQCRRRGGGLAVLCVRVDTVARSGLEVGAGIERQVRHEVSNRIGNAVRASDTILRESDRDACVVLPGADMTVAARVGERLRRMVNGDYRVGGELLQVRVHVGAAAHPAHGARAAELLRRASGEEGL